MILGDPNHPPRPVPPPKPEMAPPSCAKCGAIMELGLIPDHAHGNSELQPEWAAGKAVDGLFGLQFSGRRLNIRTYRCIKCGYLESYAP